MLNQHHKIQATMPLYGISEVAFLSNRNLIVRGVRVPPNPTLIGSFTLFPGCANLHAAPFRHFLGMTIVGVPSLFLTKLNNAIYN